MSPLRVRTRPFDGSFYERAGRVLRDIRQELDLSLTQAGVLSSSDPWNLQRQEEGTRILNLWRVRTYLVAYGVSWEEFGERLHRLDVILPNEAIDPIRLNQIRCEREKRGLNRYTGRPVGRPMCPQGLDVSVNGDAGARSVAACIHQWCRRRAEGVVLRTTVMSTTLGGESA